ncbi:hypothetical protein RclHR1_05010001 [Rhizophagus clarus]|uniref:Mating type protein MAT1-1-3 n=1 Tax=Rhizophagus clarus TaxID=94130 RepID=A0A2Z6RLZ7_9GLOM|nr:hypothetical protein RclHR1_05010001 [Rhizophagus clarus]GES74276.1 mating type protein MAT1-1-3 [Rhizophagus clarus]
MYIHVFNLNNSSNCDYNSLNNNVILEPDPNKPMCFDTKSKTDDEIIYSSKYKFNYNIEILINNSDNTRLAKNNKKNGTRKIPRRQNAWILYRRDKSLNSEFIGLKSALISKEISKMWNKEEKGTIELFEALARKATEMHKKKYGENYKYKPRFSKKSSKNKQRKEERIKNMQKKYKNEKVKSVRRKNEKEKIMKERVRNHQNKESLSELTVIEEQFPPTPLTSSPTTPSYMEFELELEINTGPTPTVSSPATPSSLLEFEQLPELLINAEQNFFPTLAVSSSTSSEELSPDLAMSIEQAPPSTPLSLGFEQSPPELEINAEQLFPTPVVSSPATPSSLEFEQLSELLISREKNFFPTLEISSSSSEELLPDLTTMSAEQFLLTPLTFLPEASEFEDKLPDITINTDQTSEMSSPITSLSFEFEELLDLSLKLVINATNKEEFSPSSVASLLTTSSTFETEESLSKLLMNIEQQNSLSSTILNSTPFIVFEKLLSDFIEQAASNCHSEAISSSLSLEESDLSNTTESEKGDKIEASNSLKIGTHLI